MKIPITQSDAWAKLQKDLNEKSHMIKGNNHQFLAIEKHTPVGSYLYCPYGPVASDKTAFNASINALEALGRELDVVFIRVEPIEANQVKLLPKNSQKTKDLNPKETWLLNLTGTDDDLKRKLPSRLIRYHKSAKNKGITIEKSHDPHDIKYLLALQKNLARKKGISTFSEHYLATELSQPFATLYMVKQKGEVLAAGLVFDDETTRYNLQGAQSDEGKKQHATGILTIQLILDAKQKGLETFDFWGIAPENAPDDHPWKGFTSFKKTFSGEAVSHAGTYDIVLKPSKYRFYKSTRKLNRLLHK